MLKITTIDNQRSPGIFSVIYLRFALLLRSNITPILLHEKLASQKLLLILGHYVHEVFNMKKFKSGTHIGFNAKKTDSKSTQTGMNAQRIINEIL